MSIYLDNAATTPLDPEVLEAMKPFLAEDFGNPSSTHSHGRKVRAAIESARKLVAELMNCTPGEIIFTSGGTEADNAILTGAVEAFGIQHIISSPIEHHAVLHTIAHLAKDGKVQAHMVGLDEYGHIDFESLESLLREFPKSLVSLMQANNEIGNLLDLAAVTELCSRYDSYFHSDAVQGVGHYRHDLHRVKIHALSAAAHKFHGPKGIGFMYIRKDKKISPFIHGGPQERNMRSGTENVYGIAGMVKALEIAYRDLERDTAYIIGLKTRMMERLKETIPGITFNGDSANLERSLYTILNVSLPESDDGDMILFNLDLQGISVSGGSACGSGTAKASHVLEALYPGSKRAAVRFSFSKFNTVEEVDYAVNTLAQLSKVTV